MTTIRRILEVRINSDGSLSYREKRRQIGQNVQHGIPHTVAFSGPHALDCYRLSILLSEVHGTDSYQAVMFNPNPLATAVR